MTARRLWLPLFLMAGVTVLSGSPGVQTGSLSFTGIDKLGHLVVFGLLAIAWARCFRGLGWPPRRVLPLAVLLTAGFGLVDETIQAFNPHRTFEWGDLAADFAGAVIAASLYLHVRPLQALLELDLRDLPRLLRPKRPAN